MLRQMLLLAQFGTQCSTVKRVLKVSTRIDDPIPNFRMRRLQYCDVIRMTPLSQVMSSMA